MAFLNMELQTWAFTFGILGTCMLLLLINSIVNRIDGPAGLRARIQIDVPPSSPRQFLHCFLLPYPFFD